MSTMNDPFVQFEAIFALLWFGIMILIYGTIIIVGIAGYIMSSWGMHSIAKRRGISKPWLAWLPFGSEWILGCISDQYQLVAKGKNKSKRKILLGLSLAMVPAAVVYACAYALFMFALMGDATYFVIGGTQIAVLPLLSMLAMVIALLLLLALSVVCMVFMYMALFDLFHSCNPNSSVLFLVLSIVLVFVASIDISPLFIFLDRKKDLGMPPVEDDFAVPVPEEYAE